MFPGSMCTFAGYEQICIGKLSCLNEPVFERRHSSVIWGSVVGAVDPGSIAVLAVSCGLSFLLVLKEGFSPSSPVILFHIPIQVERYVTSERIH